MYIFNCLNKNLNLLYMEYINRLNGENQIVVLLLVIFLFGLLIVGSNKPCKCEKKNNNNQGVPAWVYKVKNNRIK